MRLLKRLWSALKPASKPSSRPASEIGSVGVSLTVDTSAFTRDMDRVQDQLERITALAERLSKALHDERLPKMIISTKYRLSTSDIARMRVSIEAATRTGRFMVLEEGMKAWQLIGGVWIPLESGASLPPADEFPRCDFEPILPILTPDQFEAIQASDEPSSQG